jgi:signal peptidase I
VTVGEHRAHNPSFQRTASRQLAAAELESFAVVRRRAMVVSALMLLAAARLGAKEVALKQPVTAMEPTIHKDQVFTMSTVSAGYRPAIGDVIVFKMPGHPDKLDLKRIEGITGNTLEVRDKNLYRNGKEVREPYVVHRDYKVYQKGMPKDLEFYVKRDQMAPHKVQPGAVFVMGDNRDESWDSRYFGDISLAEIVGTVKVMK